MGIVYKIYNDVNNKVFIGFSTTKKSIDSILLNHKVKAKNNNKHPLYKAMNDKRFNYNFTIAKLHHSEDRDELVLLAQEEIAKHNSIDKGYNSVNPIKYSTTNYSTCSIKVDDEVLNYVKLYKGSVGCTSSEAMRQLIKMGYAAALQCGLL